MSAITTPSNDLLARSVATETAPSPFTTFTTGHFVRPAPTAQPVMAPFDFGLCEVYAAEALDLDYDEPNAVCDGDLEMVSAGEAVHLVELPVAAAPVSQPEPDAVAA